jgi:MFS family permease
MNFNLLFVVLCVLAAVLYCLQNRFARASAETPPKTKDLQCFQRSYLSVYFCAVMGDWLQGPYVYALYAAYDFSRQQIALLFIVGFGASGVLGTFAGQVADKYGRRLSCQVYFILYIASCLTKHSSSFYWLLLGRLTGGVATSILFSCFESWLIAEHNKKGFPAEMLEQTLSASTLLNYTTAVVAAWLGAAVRTHFDSLVAPFDLAVVFLALGLACMTAMWGENKGETSSSADTAASYLGSSHEKVAEALAVLRSDKKIVLIGAIQSCFEAAMYIFVFMWTPKLESLYEDLPHGQVCFFLLKSIHDHVL